MAKKKSNLQNNDTFGCKPINPAYCKTCIFAHGNPPFEDLPEKSYCRIYTRAKNIQKPPDVYYEGAECEYYEKEKKRKL